MIENIFCLVRETDCLSQRVSRNDNKIMLLRMQGYNTVQTAAKTAAKRMKVLPTSGRLSYMSRQGQYLNFKNCYD